MLGAGLGTRLNKLTESLPKPLIPVFQKPLITFAFDHLADIGCRSIVINTHHRPEAYERAFPEGRYGSDTELIFRHEPVLLETGGGIANVADLLEDEDFCVYNGDILTDIPLQPALEAHLASDNLVTMLLRSEGPSSHVAWNAESGKVTDIRNLVGTGDEGRYQFTGIYFVHPDFLELLQPGVKRSVIHSFLELIRDGARLGGFLADSGNWWDLGNRETYLEVHQEIMRGSFPSYANAARRAELVQSIHPSARVDPSASIDETSCVGENAQIGPGVELQNSLIWREASVEPDSILEGVIVRAGHVASGALKNVDI